MEYETRYNELFIRARSNVVIKIISLGLCYLLVLCRGYDDNNDSCDTLFIVP